MAESNFNFGITVTVIIIPSFHSLFPSVKFLRRLELGFGGLERLALAFDGAEEAGFVTLVAGGAVLLDLDEQHVAVAVEGDVFHGLRVAAFLALHPKFLARAAPEMRLARRNGFFQRGAVHPREHHHAASFVFLDDRGNQTLRVKF